jgi:transposase
MEKTAPTSPFDLLKFFGALDWATEHHDVVIVNVAGDIVTSFRFEESTEGWHDLTEKINGFKPNLAIAVETRTGWVVERLLQLGITVYPVNPRTVASFRTRKSPSGVKNDQLDAWTIADALRTDGRLWSPLAAEDSQTQKLRILCRDEIDLIEDQTALVNRLRAAVREYYRTPLEAFDDWTVPSVWDFLQEFPTPERLAKAGKRKLENFLHTHRMWREDSGPERMAKFAKANELRVPEGVVVAKSQLVLSLVAQLRTLRAQLDKYRALIEEEFKNHDDSGIFRSLPGAGAKLAPRLLSEFGADRNRFDTAEAIQCYAGTAPVARQSGKVTSVKMRRACCNTLRATVHLWVDLSRKKCAWAQEYYQAKIKQGQTHAGALRCLGQRWLNILWKMWQERKPYDEARHMLNQQKHGRRDTSPAPSAKALQPA